MLVAIVVYFANQARLTVFEASRIVASAVGDDAGAVDRYLDAGRGVRRATTEITSEYVRSSVYTERTAGARLGLILAPDAFWESVDDGPLWNHGEWLELCSVDPETVDRIMPELVDKARGGTPRQQYVALCLIGHLGGQDSELRELCERVATERNQPGVGAAAVWAARQLGGQPQPTPSELWMNDEISGLTFARIPASEDFRRGSDADDPDRHANEDQPDEGVAIVPFWMSVTEVPWSAFQAFFRDPASYEFWGDDTREMVIEELKTADADLAAEAAVGQVNHALAEVYCD